MRRISRRVAVLVLIVFIGGVAAGGGTKSKPLSMEEMARLRPAVERDLRELLQTVTSAAPTPEAVIEEFNRCNFSRLDLGSLGEGILVEPQAGHGMSNAAMLNIYVRSGAGYRRVVEGAGFGPYLLRRQQAPPDLIFGWTSGVCTAKYYRYHYARGGYDINGCAEEDRDREPKRGEFCAIKACDDKEKLALFDPPPNKMTGDDLPKPDGPSCVVAPVLEPAQAVADSAQAAPKNQVRFMLAARTSGDCQPSDFEGGGWTTSDPANTTVDSQGLATCLHPTSRPATITFLGTFKQHKVVPSSLICK